MEIDPVVAENEIETRKEYSNLSRNVNEVTESGARDTADTRETTIAWAIGPCRVM